MATEHEHWQEQGTIYALGALDGSERVDFEAHLATGCAICAAYLKETSETLSLLYRSLQPTMPPAAVKARVFNQIDAHKIVPIGAAKPAAKSRRWPIIGGTIAAGLIGIVISAAFYKLRYEPRHTVYSAVIELLRDPETRDYTLHGAGPTPQAQGRFLWNESGEGHIFVSNLPAAPRGTVYAVWTIAQASTPRYVGTIAIDANGQGGLHVKSPRGDKPVTTFAVTIEPTGMTASPTGPMVLVSKQS